MPEEGQRIKRYRIPENFIDEGRIFKGMVRTRFFLEGCIMALIAAIPAFLIPVSSRTQRISVVVVICGIPLLLGVLGINGDPISIVLRNLKNWRNSRGVMLYNMETAALKISPLTASMNEKRASDTLIEMAENYRENKQRKMDEEVFLEGVTFQFAQDPDIKNLKAKKLDHVYRDENDAYEPAEEELDIELSPENSFDFTLDDEGDDLSFDVPDEDLKIELSEENAFEFAPDNVDATSEVETSDDVEDDFILNISEDNSDDEDF